MALTNITGIPLPLAVWLAADDYDFSPNGQRAISVTSLLKPVRQILLRERLTEENKETPDVADRIASRLGHAIHDSIEQAWRRSAVPALVSLGYPAKQANRIQINPETLTEGSIPIYLEQRHYREFRGYKISGKFDFILDGELQDFKSTSVYSYIMGDKDEIYRLQGSLYRWLSPEKITSDVMNIQFVFTDWSKAEAKRKNDYPQQRVLAYPLKLLSIEETEAWLNAKIDALEAAALLPEKDIPYCTDQDLWKTDTVWKFYSNPDNLTKSTKNFDNAADAHAFKASKGGKGIVVEVPGVAKACGYCPAFPICTQKDLYEHA